MHQSAQEGLTKILLPCDVFVMTADRARDQGVHTPNACVRGQWVDDAVTDEDVDTLCHALCGFGRPESIGEGQGLLQWGISERCGVDEGEDPKDVVCRAGGLDTTWQEG